MGDRHEFLRDLLETALDGAHYWAQVHVYSYRAGTAELTVRDEPEEGTRTVTLRTVAHGIAVARRVGLGSLSGPDYVKQFWLADRTNGDDGDYDADIADQILQLGLFEKVVYG